jgi:hypothetical protein
MKKQWSNLLQTLEIEAPGIKKIIAWGTQNYDAKSYTEEN